MSSAIEMLRKAANLKMMKKEIELNDGSYFVFYSKPLTMAERERAQRGVKDADTSGFALQLLVQKACDSSGNRMFTPGDTAVLKNEVRDDDLQKLMLAVLTSDEGEEESMDMKSTRTRAKQG